MKSKILIILVLLSVKVFGQSVPNTNTFSLQDVYNVVSSHAPATQGNLQSCFDNSNASYFDSNYGSKTMNPKTLYGFRNYTVSSAAVIASMDFTYSGSSGVGIYTYIGEVQLIGAINANATFGLNLDFLSDLVPSGQSEFRSVSINVDNSTVISRTGVGLIGQYTKFCNSDTTFIPITVTFTNDNWDYPRYNSDFRLYLSAITNCQLAEPVSTVSNLVTRVESLNGVTTTFLTISSTKSGRGHSGEMFEVNVSRNSGYTYSEANGYKNVEIKEEFFTSLQVLPFIFVNRDYRSGIVEKNYYGASYYNNDVNLETIPTLTNSNFYYRYTMLNSSGSNQSFNYYFKPSKYCSFTDWNESFTLQSRSESAHILAIYSSSVGQNSYLPIIDIYPITTTLASNETFSYALRAHGPLYQFVRIMDGGNILATLSDGQEWIVQSYPPSGNTNLSFYRYVPAGIRGKTVIHNSSDASQFTVTYLNGTDMWLEIIPISSNITVTSTYPYKFGYNGTIY